MCYNMSADQGKSAAYNYTQIAEACQFFGKILQKKFSIRDCLSYSVMIGKIANSRIFLNGQYSGTDKPAIAAAQRASFKWIYFFN